jgi:predicted DNA-binding protein with PD1-like motif
MQSKILNSGPEKTFALVLQYGEDPMEEIRQFAAKEKLQACRFTAVGAFSEAEVGFFDFSIKDYVHIRFGEQTEVLSMMGDITTYEDKPKVHAHVVLGKRDGTACGGHLLKAAVHPTLEIILTESPSWMQRKMDARSGIPLIQL